MEYVGKAGSCSNVVAVSLRRSHPDDGLVVRDPAMLRLYEQAARAARSNINVLVLGETGVGKELLIQAIHAKSARGSQPFLSLNCAGMSETLLEAELFGYEKGSFSGAHLAREGVFEAVNGGTLFLDEVGELSPSAQAKLLRVLENRKVIRLGARKETAVDVRFLAATNRNLTELAEEGRFRQDLLYRLNSLVLTVPPLRERPNEIEPIALYCLRRALRGLDRQGAPQLEPSALRWLQAYPWPGNVRELRNAMERAAVMSTGTTIHSEHLPPELLGWREPAEEPHDTSAFAATEETANDAAPASERPPLLEEVRARGVALERARIVEALAAFDGNQTKAARTLGVSRRTLVTRLAQYGLPRPRKPRTPQGSAS